MNTGIYMILNLVTEMYYIGQAINFDKRFWKHKYELNKNVHTNLHLQNAWNKYGEANFKFCILEIVYDKFQLTTREQFWLDRSKCYERNIGYNLLCNAESRLGLKHTEETKKKLSILGKGVKRSVETRAKMSAWQVGLKHSEKRKIANSNGHKGKVISEETKRKLSIACKGKKLTEEHKQILLKCNTGRKMSEETKLKISIAKLGKMYSEETKQKMLLKRATKKNGLGNSIGQL